MTLVDNEQIDHSLFQKRNPARGHVIVQDKHRQAFARCILEDCRDVARDMGISPNSLRRWNNAVAGHNGVKPFRNRVIRIRVPEDPAALGYLAGIVDGEGWITYVRTVGLWHVGVSNT